MQTWVALLYSIVLGPKRRVVMAELRALAAELGFAAPRTLLASGNLIVEAEASDARAVEARIEPAFAARFGRPIDIIVRAGAEWNGLLAGNPFPEESARAPSRVWARVMRAPVDAALAGRLERWRAGGERVAVVGGDLWVFMPDGVAGSRLASAMTPARTGGAGTFRNWNTLRKIGAALDGGPVPAGTDG
ncbi:MAG: DUF1697 domain-containing protein [Amaricoccus sp.]